MLVREILVLNGRMKFSTHTSHISRKVNDMMHSIGRVSLIGLFEKGDYTFRGLVYVEDLMMFTVH